jgi:hypothetical protein
MLDCMRRDPLPAKAGRRWGGRPVVKDRQCDPNDCQLFQAGNCKHVGSLYFWIPGLETAELCCLTFTSVYAPLNISPTLSLVANGLGRVSGLYNGKAMFRLSKSLDRVSRVDPETGKPEKTAQWIINLSSTLDMVRVLSGATEDAQASLPPPQAALPEPDLPPETTEHAEVQPAATSPVDTFRAQRDELIALRDNLQWNNQQLGEWLTENFGDPKVASDPRALPEVLEQLNNHPDLVPF